MNLPPLKYQLSKRFEALQDPTTVELIQALSCWRLRIWHTTFYRKMYASQDEHRKDRLFSRHELLTICQVYNELCPQHLPLTLQSVLADSISHVTSSPSDP